ncbi:MAG: glycosyltransferase family 4 protein [Patescibacteria group bacterium]
MRIAFIGQKGIPTKFGGIERHVEELSRRLVKAGNQVFVYCRPWYTPKNRSRFQGINLVTLPSIQRKHLDAISHTLISTLHALTQDYDIIHYHGVGPALLSFIPRIFKPKTKVIVTFHCIDRKHQKWGWFARLSLKLGEAAACYFPHKTITVSKTLQYYCSQIFNCDTVYIPNGVSPKGKYDDNLIKQKFALEKGSYILAVARLVRHKGIHYLVQAYQHLHTNKKLVIVGGSAFTDDYVDELKQLAANSPQIIFTGYQEGKMLDQLFNNAFLVVHPSESEGLPLAVLEAMSYGTPVLASDIAENLEVVKGNGFSFRNKSVSDLERKLKFLLGQPLLVRKIGRQSRGYVMENYNWDDIVQKIQVVYDEEMGYKKLVSYSSQQA